MLNFSLTLHFTVISLGCVTVSLAVTASLIPDFTFDFFDVESLAPGIANVCLLPGQCFRCRPLLFPPRAQYHFRSRFHMGFAGHSFPLDIKLYRAGGVTVQNIVVPL